MANAALQAPGRCIHIQGYKGEHDEAKVLALYSLWKAAKLQNDMLNNKYKFMQPCDKLS